MPFLKSRSYMGQTGQRVISSVAPEPMQHRLPSSTTNPFWGKTWINSRKKVGRESTKYELREFTTKKQSLIYVTTIGETELRGRRDIQRNNE